MLKRGFTGYRESIKDNPEADWIKRQAALNAVSRTYNEIDERLCKDLQELVKNNVNVEMSSGKN